MCSSDLFIVLEGRRGKLQGRWAFSARRQRLIPETPGCRGAETPARGGDSGHAPAMLRTGSLQDASPGLTGQGRRLRAFGGRRLRSSRRLRPYSGLAPDRASASCATWAGKGRGGDSGLHWAGDSGLLSISGLNFLPSLRISLSLDLAFLLIILGITS